MKHSRTIKDTWDGKLTDFSEIKLGQAEGVPTDFELVRKEKIVEGKESTFSYNLIITIVNNNRISFYGRYGFPYANRLPDYEYGHGFGGYIHQAPKQILEYISEITGVNLLQLG